MRGTDFDKIISFQCKRSYRFERNKIRLYYFITTETHLEYANLYIGILYLIILEK